MSATSVAPASATPVSPTIVKRDGKLTSFNAQKIRSAVYRCLINDCQLGEAEANSVAETVTDQVESILQVRERVSVEEIQNVVEQQLMATGHHQAARYYILYREKHKQLREEHPVSEQTKELYRDAVSYFTGINSHLQAVQAFDKFARFRPELGRREVWPETVERVLAFFQREIGGRRPGAVGEEAWEELKRGLLRMEATPSMRCIQMAGPPLERDNVGAFNCLAVETQFVTDTGVRSFLDCFDGQKVRVLSHTGQWRDAVVRCYGIQPLRPVTFARSRTRVKVWATADHRWWLATPLHEASIAKKLGKAAENASLLRENTSLLDRDGVWETTELQVGDRLVTAPTEFEDWTYESANPLERLYWAYGFVYGDGTINGDYSMVRLCGEKNRFLSRFEELGFESSRPLSCGGDNFVYTGKYLRSLPDIATDGVGMLRAFVRGWLDADGAAYTGTVGSSFRSIQVTGREAIEFVRRVFPVVGVYLTNEEDLTDQVTNYGKRSDMTIRFGLVSYFGKKSNSHYSCVEIGNEERTEEVWCLEVEEDNSFVLPSGVVTGNCSYLGMDSPTSLSEDLYLLMQGCLPPDTPVFTEAGPRRIDEIRIGDRVWGYDREAGKRVLATVTATHDVKVPVDTNVRLTTRHGQFTTSQSHPVAVYRDGVWQYVPAGSVKLGDTMMRLAFTDECGDDTLLKKAWLAGAFLGDGLQHDVVKRIDRGVEDVGEDFKDITVDGCHSYFCGFGVFLLSHNCGVGFSVESRYVEQWPRVKRQKGLKPDVYVIEDTTEAWCDALKHGVERWLDGGDYEFDYSAIRPAGAVLKTKGGRSSGPSVLRDLLKFARERILSRQGSVLTSLDIHDITCKAHQIVQMGGVRRASGISLSGLNDHAMRHCKDGQFWNENPQRNQANNSAVYESKPTAVEFMEEWLALAKSGSGERGIFNRGSLKTQIPNHRHWVDDFGVNPCVTADTWVLTDEGPKQVLDVLDKPFHALVDGIPRWATGFFPTGVKPVLKIRLENGMSVRVTGNHRIRKVTYRTAKTTRTDWVEAKDLKPGDEVVLHNHRDAIWVGRGTAEEGYLLGNLVGDGCFNNKDGEILDYWGESREEDSQYAVATIRQAVGARSDCVGTEQKAASGKRRVQSARLGRLAAEFGIDREKVLGPTVEKTSSDFHAGFLRGWFDADGTVTGDQRKGVSVRLNSPSLPQLEVAQRMLARLGIISTIYPCRREAQYRLLPDGKGGMKEYWCKDNHDLVISNENLKVFQQRVGFRSKAKAQRLEDLLGRYKRRITREKFSSAIESIEEQAAEPVYDVTVPSVNAFDANGLYVHNCGEIILRNRGLCNLSIAVIRPQDDLPTIRRKLRLATIWGCLQSMLTRFQYLRDDWRRNAEEERLLGVDLLGNMDSPLLRPGAPGREDLMQLLRGDVEATDREWSVTLNKNPSASTTCIKPSGDSSVFFDTAAGLKPHHGKFWIRRLRFQAENPMAEILKSSGVPYQADYDKSGLLVFEFPCRAPEGGIVMDDMSAIDQLENWLAWKRNYTTHNPSVTVTVRPEEWFEVGLWVYSHWDEVGGLSFLPHFGGNYPLAPYETCSQEEYEQRMAAFPEIQWWKLARLEQEDYTTLSQEFACSAGGCEVR